MHVSNFSGVFLGKKAPDHSYFPCALQMPRAGATLPPLWLEQVHDAASTRLFRFRFSVVTVGILV